MILFFLLLPVIYEACLHSTIYSLSIPPPHSPVTLLHPPTLTSLKPLNPHPLITKSSIQPYQIIPSPSPSPPPLLSPKIVAPSIALKLHNTSPTSSTKALYKYAAELRSLRIVSAPAVCQVKGTSEKPKGVVSRQALGRPVIVPLGAREAPGWERMEGRGVPGEGEKPCDHHQHLRTLKA
jgi:hypothetical protein